MANLDLTAAEMIKSLPQRYKADEMEEPLNATFQFIISGDRGGEFTLNLEEGECVIKEGLEGKSDCTIKCVDSVYEEIELGERKAQTALLTGAIKISDIFLMMKFLNLFEFSYKQNKK